MIKDIYGSVKCFIWKFGWIQDHNHATIGEYMLAFSTLTTIFSGFLAGISIFDLQAFICIFPHAFVRFEQNLSTLQTTVGDTVPVNSDFG